MAWVSALIGCCFVVGSYEAFLRTHHLKPSIEDDADLWAIQFDIIKSNHNGIALLGASRIQFGVDPELMSRLLGGAPVAMLAVNGEYPVATLRAIAEETAFAGVVVVGIDSRGLSKSTWDMQRPYIDHYRVRWSPARRLHREILSWLQGYGVFARPEFSAIVVAKHWLGHQDVAKDYGVTIARHRGGGTDFARPELPLIRHNRVAQIESYYLTASIPTPDEWLADLDVVSTWIKRIEDRGGKVILFREPVAGESLMLDEAHFPRALYWDRYAKRSPAKMIDFRDTDEFRDFSLPDTSHIDRTDIPLFTEALVHLLQRQNVTAIAGAKRSAERSTAAD
jgi:hypothetical protein